MMALDFIVLLGVGVLLTDAAVASTTASDLATEPYSSSPSHYEETPDVADVALTAQCGHGTPRNGRFCDCFQDPTRCAAGPI